ncbi:MAG: glycine--tRNA ligase [Kiritimatiellae bacterium]|nr:glycine--tRNA ligase [Kiritimatiellia bacterium]
MSEQQNVTMDALASLCKRRGFIYQTSEPYGGLNGFWDYGPLGCELKRNIREAWWRAMVHRRDDVVGLDAAIIMHPRVWEASGHLEGFTDPMVDCRACRRRFRADQLCEEQGRKLEKDAAGRLHLPAGVRCSACGSMELTEPRSFNLMFRTFVGPVEDESAVAYLRPETAQGIFVNFPTILNTTRVKVPFGIAQIGKAFRNEINPRNFTFRSREFEQMELEYFVKPGTDAQWHEYWVNERIRWYASIGLPEGRLHRYVYARDELAHYASACVDITYEFPFGTQELEGIAARGDYDLRRHQQFSGKSFEYFDAETNERYLPHVVEPSAGVDRIALALLCEAYREEWVPTAGVQGGVLPAVPDGRPPEGYEPRIVMRFAPCMAPFKAAVFPLLKNKPPLVERARRLFEELRRRWLVFYDEQGAIGRRYRRQDEIGTPFGITVDFQTLDDDTVTIRDRDTMAQTRVPAAEVPARIAAAVEFG